VKNNTKRLSISSPNIDSFSSVFHWHTGHRVFNKSVIKVPADFTGERILKIEFLSIRGRYEQESGVSCFLELLITDGSVVWAASQCA